MKTARLSLLLLLCALVAPHSRADAPRQLMWEDLAPKPPAAENPFARLKKDQLLALSDIASVRERLARGEKVSAIDLEDEQGATRRLSQAGIDVDALLVKRKEMAEQKRAQSVAVNTALDGQIIRMPGYLLPLEYSGKKVTEFLLVPWVGACIHTPPPPPNQIVHVKADKPIEINGMFSPVWVTGQLGAHATKKSLYFLDGASDIDVGYSLRATEVEPYKQ